MSRVLVTGAGGQVGRALVATLGPRAVPRTHSDLDITDAAAVRASMEDVGVVVNAAAYTDVDRAQNEPDAAFAVNAAGAGNVARAAHEAGAFCVHLSTDFVFDGTLGRPYREDDVPNPISVYSASKLEGERLVRAVGGNSGIVRTAWVYAAGYRNFLSTILERAREGATLDVVTDQIGSPTWATDLAGALMALIDRPVAGLFHVAGGGEASRYEFARAIVEADGLDPALVRPVRTGDVPPRPAPRAAYAPLEPAAWTAAGFSPLRHWREALGEAIKEF